MLHLRTFGEFLCEGGNALGNVRPIKQSEIGATLDSIRDVVFPLIGIAGDNVLLLGSMDKAEDSGDLDVGLPMKEFCEANGVDEVLGMKYLYDLLGRNFPEFQTEWMRGLELVSMAYPIKGDPSLGYVQVDFIPVKDMEWAKFIYYSPNRLKGESAYKSAHRNMLLRSVLFVVKENEDMDESGNLLGYDGLSLRLNDGLYQVRRSFVGKRGLLKNPVTISEKDSLLTSVPKDFVNALFGPECKVEDVRTFEQCWAVITSPGSKYADKMEEIKESLIKELKKAKLEVPAELCA